MYKSLLLESTLSTNVDTFYRNRNSYHMMLNDNLRLLEQRVIAITKSLGYTVEGSQIEQHDVYIKLEKPISTIEAARLYVAIASQLQLYDFTLIENSNSDGKAETTASSSLFKVSL